TVRSCRRTRQLRIRNEARRCSCPAARRATQSRICGRRAIRHSPGLPQTHALQNGFRRGGLHFGIAHHASRTHVLSQCRVCHVRSGGAEIPVFIRVFPSP